MRVASIVGARPQFVKAAVVSRALRAAGIDEFVVHTGQHYDDNMSQIFFDELERPRPKYNLGVGSGPQGAQTGRMLEAIEHVLLEERTDCVLVFGDTNSTLAGALAATKLRMPVAHVEAGLRSFNCGQPEEINRVITDRISALLFAPTATAVANLRREGIAEHKIRCVGDVMYDAAMFYRSKATQRSEILRRLSLRRKGYVLATVHRAENTNDPKRLSAIVGSLALLSRDLPVVFPVHPRTRKAMQSTSGIDVSAPRFLVIEPVGFLDMIMLEENAALIATDSGGVQKEAFFYHVGCVTLRDETEWLELVELGWNRVVPPVSSAEVAEAIRAALAAPLGSRAHPYGNGNSSQQIAQTLSNVAGPAFLNSHFAPAN